jgi:protein transport protein SEC23
LTACCPLHPGRRDQQDAQQQAQSNQQFYLQFVTKYLHWSGELRCRVTTVTRRWTAAGAGDLIQVRKECTDGADAVMMCMDDGL